MTSDMPSYQGQMNGDQLADLLAYLVSLKGNDAPYFVSPFADFRHGFDRGQWRERPG